MRSHTTGQLLPHWREMIACPLLRAGDLFSVPRDQLPGPHGPRNRFEATMILKQRVAMDILSRLLMLSAMIFIGVIVLYWR